MRSHADTLLSDDDDDDEDGSGGGGEDKPLNRPSPLVGMGLMTPPPVGDSSRCFVGDPAEDADEATEPGGLAVRGLPGSKLREEGTCASGVTGANA